MTREGRLVGFLVTAMFAYIATEALVARRRAFLDWRQTFAARLSQPGRREFLRAQMMSEEMREGPRNA